MFNIKENKVVYQYDADGVLLKAIVLDATDRADNGDVEFFVRNIKTNSVDIRYRSDRLGRNLRWLALGV